MNKKIIALTFLSLVIFSGCASFPVRKESAPPQPLEAQPVLKFEDVPIPQGFLLLSKESFTFQTDTTRVGLLKYRGRVKADRVVGFYREQMPQYGWNLVNLVEYGRRMLNFESNGQSCIITVEPTKTKTILIISIAPKSRSYGRGTYKGEREE